ncbi:hypothetical protein BWD42_15725 [Sphingobacterium sp. CZ-UAM]|jgi:hypothetical protein|nr:hypothetical protein BWD42_15725 [Sphingobacterium sp. CZ-UAM]
MLLRNFNIGFALEMKLQQSDKSRDSEGFLALFYCGCNLLVVALCMQQHANQSTFYFLLRQSYDTLWDI